MGGEGALGAAFEVWCASQNSMQVGKDRWAFLGP